MNSNLIKFMLFVGMLTLFTSCFGVRVRGSGNVISEKREVRNFESVELDSFGDVYIEQGDRPGVIIEADDQLMEYVTTDVRGGTLHLDAGSGLRNFSVNNADLRFIVTVSDLEEVTISGSGDVFIDDLEMEQLELVVGGSGDFSTKEINGERLDLSIGGSGDITVQEVTVDEINSVVRGSGNLTVSGQVEEQVIRIAGSGDYRSADLESESAEVDIRGSGNVDLWVTDIIEIDVGGSGDVRYYGSPSEVKQQIGGSGEVNALGRK